MLCHVFVVFHLLLCYLHCNFISGRGCISFWDGNLGTQIESFQTHKADILCLCLAEDENSLYCAGKFSVDMLYISKHAFLTFLQPSNAFCPIFSKE